MPAPRPTTEICSKGVMTRAVVSGYGLPTVNARAIPAIRAIPGETKGISESAASNGKAKRRDKLALLAELHSSRQVMGDEVAGAVVEAESWVLSAMVANLAPAV